ncbi:MAG: HEPN domain-containing protein [Anaerolineae bacterium]|nr:HEPN domain-containing protein [Anaerolineae bacterium]
MTGQLTINPHIQLPPVLQEALQRFCQAVLTRFPGLVEEIILYGSWARGDADAESDVDLLLLVNWEEERLGEGCYRTHYGDPRWQAIVDISYDLMLEYGTVISPQMMSREICRTAYSLRKNIERDGVRLWPVFGETEIAPHVAIALRESPPSYEVPDDEERLAEARTWLALAEEKLPLARQFPTLGLFDETVSKSYCVMFYAARAALALENIRPHRHSGVAAKFGEYFAKTGRVESTLGRKLREAMKAREDADYDPQRRASREEAERLLADATEFLQAIKTLFENLPPASDAQCNSRP